MVATNDRIGAHMTGRMGCGLNGPAMGAGNRLGRSRSFAIFIDGEWVSIGALKREIDAACRRFWKRRGRNPPQEWRGEWWKAAVAERNAKERAASESESGK